MTDECPLMKCKCVKTHYGIERCSENPSLTEATKCIEWQRDKILELEAEVKALDEVVNLEKGEHTKH